MSIAQNTRLVSKNLKASFTEKQISSNVAYTYIQCFKDIIGFRSLLHRHLGRYDSLKARNSRFTVTDTIDFMVDAVFQGYSRFCHMDALRNDRTYLAIRGGAAPSEKVCRNMLARLPREAAKALRKANRELLSMQAKAGQPREVAADFDDTVVTVFGRQEKACAGYNPRYHGRPSYKEKVGVISGTKELVDLTLEEGNHHSNHGFLSFFRQFEASLPEEWILKRVRADSGFFNDRNFTYFEDHCYEYVVKAKMTANIQKIVDWVCGHPQDYLWEAAGKQPGERAAFHTTGIRIALPGWERDRRFVIVRKTLPANSEDGQLLFDECRYEYQAIVTNIDYLTSAEVFKDYNQRCTVETSIDELKSGFAFSENSQLDYTCNELYLLIKMLACNLHNWFRQAILPEEERNHRVGTLRRMLYRVCGMITGSGWYRHVEFQKDAALEKVVTYVRKSLSMFRIAHGTG